MHHQGPKQPPSDAPCRMPRAENSKPQKSSVPLRALCGEPVTPWIPESKLPQVPLHPVNSFVRKILLATPAFPRFYADVVLATRPNSHEAKILRPHYQKILEKVNAMSNDHACTHIKVTGVRCDSPALRGEQFCYFHQNAHRGVRRPPQSRLHPIALIEDEESIHVGTAAIGCPAQAKPSASVGTDAFVPPASAASVPTPAATTPAKVTSSPAAVPPHDFKTPQPAPQQNASPKSQSAPSQRRPPENVKPAPQERKITTHAERRG